MKKLFLSFVVFGALVLLNGQTFAQPAEGTNGEETVEEVNDNSEGAVDSEELVEDMAEEVAPLDDTMGGDIAEEDRTFHQRIKKIFIDGGAFFMGIVLICFILGLAISIERIIYLTMATTNSTKLLKNVESALENGGVDAAKEVCRNTSGPVASIFYQGLDRHEEGLDMVEKSVTAYGNVQAGLLEKGVSWISLFIALAPMLGFMGTVFGMIDAFDAIEAANNISPSIVAGGIKVALITTVAGLIVAVILQIFYNFIVAKVDSVLNDMENASISLVDLLIAHSKKG